MIELDGTLKSVKFQGKGEERDVIGTITIECHPNELAAGRLSRLAGKDVSISISSYQLDLPLKEEEQPAHVVIGD